MLKTLKNIFGGYKKQIESLATQLEQTTTQLIDVTTENRQMSVQLDELKQLLDKQNSITPWFTIVAEGIDPIKGIETRMDWNEAFTQYLKDSGLGDSDEFLAIQKWIAMLHEDTIVKLEQRIIENSDLIKQNKYT